MHNQAGCLAHPTTEAPETQIYFITTGLEPFQFSRTVDWDGVMVHLGSGVADTRRCRFWTGIWINVRSRSDESRRYMIMLVGCSIA